MKTTNQDISKDSLSELLAFANRKIKASNSEASPSPSSSSHNAFELNQEVSLHVRFIKFMHQKLPSTS